MVAIVRLARGAGMAARARTAKACASRRRAAGGARSPGLLLSLLLAVAAAGAGGRQATAAGAVPRALRIVQRTGGLQGKTPESPRESVLQALTIDAEGKRLVLSEYPGVEWPAPGGASMAP